MAQHPEIKVIFEGEHEDQLGLDGSFALPLLIEQYHTIEDFFSVFAGGIMHIYLLDAVGENLVGEELKKDVREVTLNRHYVVVENPGESRKKREDQLGDFTLSADDTIESFINHLLVMMKLNYAGVTHLILSLDTMNADATTLAA